MIYIIAKKYKEVNIKMNPIVALCPVIEKKTVAQGIFDIKINSPELAKNSHPGQFLHVKCGNYILRRPISICDINCDSIVRFLFDVRGDGTEWLSTVKIGDTLDILGPLGKGFEILPSDKRAIFVGGGIGIYPLLATCKTYKAPTVFLGFRNKSYITLIDDFVNYGAIVDIATDDGSTGYHGLVTNLLEEHLKTSTSDMIYTCGPKLMMKKVAEIAREYNIRCQVSMEERMGCGVGACLVCACRTYKKDGSETHSFVCKDGPIYESEEVVW
ncbi:MAG: dihydroorotate dehydrogenase electron transfer subunit [bacterium]